MEKKTIVETGLFVLLLVPFIYLASVWTLLPEQVPTHYNVHGEVDRYSEKSDLIWMLLLIQALPFFLMKYIPRLDPRRKAEGFGPNYGRLRVVIVVFMTALGCLLVHSAYRDINLALIVPVLIGGLSAGIGNYIITAKSNYFIGIRTPWTLENEEVWRKTHRLGGRMMFWTGLASIALSFLLPAQIRLVVVVVLLGLSSVIPVIYSYLVYQQIKG